MVLTKKQLQIYEYLRNFMIQTGRAPSFPEIQSHFGFQSKATVHQYLKTLESKGYLKRFPYQRGTMLFPKEKDKALLKGIIRAGLPVEVYEQYEEIEIPASLQNRTKEIYALEVRGESMIDAHIQDGDVVFLEERDYARDGDIIAACVNGETTLKFYKPRKDGVYLLPANSQMAPIKVEGDFQIQGVLVGLLRVY